ncbi:MAG: hypothetical protein QXW75_00525 [Thermoplasmatales archaeon]
MGKHEVLEMWKDYFHKSDNTLRSSLLFRLRWVANAILLATFVFGIVRIMDGTNTPGSIFIAGYGILFAAMTMYGMMIVIYMQKETAWLNQEITLREALRRERMKKKTVSRLQELAILLADEVRSDHEKKGENK